MGNKAQSLPSRRPPSSGETEPRRVGSVQAWQVYIGAMGATFELNLILRFPGERESRVFSHEQKDHQR